MPIRIRLAVLSAVGMFVVYSLAGLWLEHGLSSSLTKDLNNLVRSRAHSLANAGEIARQIAAVAPASTPPEVANPASSPTGVAPTTIVPGTAPLNLDIHGTGAVFAQVFGPGAVQLEASPTAPDQNLLTPAQYIEAKTHNVQFTTTLRPGTSPIVVNALAVSRTGGSVVVAAGESTSTIGDSMEATRDRLLLAAPALVLLAGIGAWLLAGAALAPVSRMRRQAEEISASDSDVTIAVPRTRDEIAELAETINGMLARLQGALSRQRGFVSAASHELRTPLTILKGELQLALDSPQSKDDLVNAVCDASREADRLVRLAEDLLLLANSDENTSIVDRTEQNISTIVARSIDRFATHAASSSVTIDFSAESGIVAFVDEWRIRQVVDNVLDNALKFAPPDSTISVRLSRVAARNEVCLDIADQGPGLPPEFVPTAFDRFSRVRDKGARTDTGSGLGLAIVATNVHAHGGRVSIANRRSGGARVTIILPAMPTEEPRRPSSRREAAATAT